MRGSGPARPSPAAPEAVVSGCCRCSRSPRSAPQIGRGSRSPASARPCLRGPTALPQRTAWTSATAPPPPTTAWPSQASPRHSPPPPRACCIDLSQQATPASPRRRPNAAATSDSACSACAVEATRASAGKQARSGSRRAIQAPKEGRHPRPCQRQCRPVWTKNRRCTSERRAARCGQPHPNCRTAATPAEDGRDLQTPARTAATF
mmetsp:Transcript_2982/g.11487  ORF Transcript_2982/g.11487 Transcript_2982/m.11487 type:complete len:206 (-) Transcript_2982:412-1029(-)